MSRSMLLGAGLACIGLASCASAPDASGLSTDREVVAYVTQNWDGYSARAAYLANRPRAENTLLEVKNVECKPVEDRLACTFTTRVRFADGVEEIKHLKIGMILEGVVTNVAAFGAFVDIGVHQDGLVHISALSDTYVKDPRDVVKAGDIVKVRVLEVDIPRKRIALTRRLDDVPAVKAPQDNARRETGPRDRRPEPRNAKPAAAVRPQQPPANNALAAAFARAKYSG